MDTIELFLPESLGVRWTLRVNLEACSVAEGRESRGGAT